MTLFSTPVQNDTRFFEALVLGVDATRGVCKVQTSFGQSLDGVPWMSSIYEAPEFNDRVLVTYITGYPIIMGILPRVGTISDFATNIDSDLNEADTGNYSQLTRGLVNDPLKPRDFIAGDKIISNEMGGLFGLLKGGSFVAKAGRLAQILLSKYDDLVRIIGRNYELFTDLCIDTIASVRGRTYRFIGYAQDLAAGRSDVYTYQELYGDTTLANSLKWNYYGLTPGTFASQPATNDIIRKYLITDGGVGQLMFQNLHLTGQYYTKVQNVAGSSYTYVDHQQGTWDTMVLNNTFTRLTATPTSIVLTYDDTNTFTINASKLELDFGGLHKVVVDAGKVEMDFGGVNKVTATAAKVELNYASGTHTFALTSTGILGQFNGGAHYFRADSTGMHLG